MAGIGVGQPRADESVRRGARRAPPRVQLPAGLPGSGLVARDRKTIRRTFRRLSDARAWRAEAKSSSAARDDACADPDDARAA
jgi:hypothetical protein